MILVAGATGALGGTVARDLLARGHTVRVLVRPGSDYEGLLEAGAQPVMGDLRDPDALVRACTGATTVLTTANSAARRGAGEVDAVDRAGNRALIDAAAGAGVEHFIFVSAYGSSLESPSDFLRAKAETEAYLERSGLAFTILQPNAFMDTWVEMIVGAPLQQGAPVTLLGRGDRRHAFVALADVAAFACAAVEDPGLRGRRIPIGGPAAVTWTQVVRTAEQVLGRPVPVEYVAPGEPLPGLPPELSEIAAAMESCESAFDTSELAGTLGIRLTPVEESLKGVLRLPLPGVRQSA